MLARTNRKRLHPGVAVLLLAGAAVFAGKMLWRSAPQAVGGGAPIAGDLDPAGGEQVVETAGIEWRDLLQAHGSEPADVRVRNAFSLLDASAIVAAAPIAETSPTPKGEWIGDDPPQLHLSVILVSNGSRRCVLDGKVVGVGDAVAGGRLVAIQRDLVRLNWHDFELTYDLDGDAPREFRAELSRRRRKTDLEQSGALPAVAPDEPLMQEGN